MRFKYLEHRAVYELCSRFNHDLLETAQACLCSGTAISMLLDEYRVGNQITLITNRTDSGHRMLKSALSEHGLQGLFSGQINVLKPHKNFLRRSEGIIEQYGCKIKFRLLYDSGAYQQYFNSKLCCRVLSHEDLYMHKNDSNIYTYKNDYYYSRDAIDLIMMKNAWNVGHLGGHKFDKEITDQDFHEACRKLSDPNWFAECVSGLRLSDDAVQVIQRAIKKEIVLEI